MSFQSSLDEMFDALANVHRRRLLASLLEHNPQEVENLQFPEDGRIDEEERERLQTRMHHIHLPRLEEAGLIRWERGTGTVVKGPRFEEIRPLLELLDEHADDLPSDLF